jgi:hypothetical protein
MTTRAVTPETLGAWVITCSPRLTALEPMLAAGRAQRLWCVARNYRAALMAPGQRVLLWVAAHPHRGIWGDGTLLDAPAVQDGRLRVPTDIPLLGEPVTAPTLRATPGAEHLEILRSPQQANPSWVSRSELAVIDPLLRAASRFVSRHL